MVAQDIGMPCVLATVCLEVAKDHDEQRHQRDRSSKIEQQRYRADDENNATRKDTALASQIVGQGVEGDRDECLQRKEKQVLTVTITGGVVETRTGGDGDGGEGGGKLLTIAEEVDCGPPCPAVPEGDPPIRM